MLNRLHRLPPVWILFSISIATLEFVPTFNSFSTIFFLGSCFLVAAHSLFCLVRLRETNEDRFKLSNGVVNNGSIIILFIAYLSLVNPFIAVANEIPIEAFLRALTPFLFLCMFFFARWSRLTSTDVIWIIFLSAIVFSLRVLITNYSDVLFLMTGGSGRLTYVEKDLLVPLALVGFVIALYMPLKPALLRAVLLLIFLLVIVLSGYRSQLLLVGAAVLTRYGVMSGIKWIAALLAMVLLVYLIDFFGFSVLDRLLDREVTASGDSVRLNEIKFALSLFVESPVLGHGLGTEIPMLLTRPDSFIDSFDLGAIRYIHNGPAYFLMDGGIIGLALYIALFFSVLNYIKPIIFGSGSGATVAGAFLLVIIFFYFLISASFRQVQMMSIVGLLLHALSVSGRGRLRRRSR